MCIRTYPSSFRCVPSSRGIPLAASHAQQNKLRQKKIQSQPIAFVVRQPEYDLLHNFKRFILLKLGNKSGFRAKCKQVPLFFASGMRLNRKAELMDDVRQIIESIDSSE